jgi:hypothetical protein
LTAWSSPCCPGWAPCCCSSAPPASSPAAWRRSGCSATWTTSTSRSAVTADLDGRVYVGLDFYQRVQQYDADGNFLRGWQLDAATKSFRLTVDEQGRLVAATSRGNNHIYSPDGGILESRPDNGEMYNDLADSARHGIVGADGSTYRLESRFVSPRVVRIDRDGTTQTVVSQPRYKGFLMGPLPSWLLWMLGIVTLGATDHLKKARRRVNRSGTFAR